MSLSVFPPKVISINQSPDYKHDHITLRWVIEARRGDLPLLGFQFKVACSSAQKTLITAVFIVQFKSKTLNNSSVFQHSLQTGCPATTLPEKPVYVEIKSFNSYLFSPTRHLITKYQYVGMIGSIFSIILSFNLIFEMAFFVYQYSSLTVSV